jgi:hypothetical protein
MVGYMSLRERADRDFALARRKARLGRIGARLRRSNAAWQELLCFEEVGRFLGGAGGVYRGPRTVPPGRIVGSVGRCRGFDRDFLPLEASVGERWKRIDLAFHRGEELPPVSLYKVGGVYFVSDGDHRVSVYLYHGLEWIDAVVTEFSAPSATPSPMESTRPRTIEEPKEHSRSKGAPERGDPKMRESMFDFETWKRRREEMMREVERNRLAKASRDSRKRRGSDRASPLAWELKRIVGRLLKLLRNLRNAG